MPRLEPKFIPPAELSEEDIRFLVGIGRHQALLIDELRAALEGGGGNRARSVLQSAHKQNPTLPEANLVQQIVGAEPAKKGNRS
jgi:hypothetical protein